MWLSDDDACGNLIFLKYKYNFCLKAQWKLFKLTRLNTMCVYCIAKHFTN